MGHQAILKRSPRLLLITDSRLDLRLDRKLEILEQALRGGVDAILLRERLDKPQWLALAAETRALTASHGASLFIHTHADIVAAVDADGLHLPSRMIDDVPAARQWLQDHGLDNVLISVACHDADELRRAGKRGSDLALLSPVFPTRSHPDRPALGVERFRELARRAGMPVLALGGITTENRKLLAGHGVAVISAIMHAPQPEKAAALLGEDG